MLIESGKGSTPVLVKRRSLFGSALVGAAMSLMALQPNQAQAGGADVVGVEAVRDNAGKWRFNVSVAHADEGWDHYADKWDVVAPDGTILGTRVLHHPHETEQPFTRSLSGIVIPETIDEVTVRAHDNQHGYDGKPMSVKLKR